MSSESRRVAGIILVVLPTVLYGGFLLLGAAGEGHGAERVHLSGVCVGGGVGGRAGYAGGGAAKGAGLVGQDCILRGRLYRTSSGAGQEQGAGYKPACRIQSCPTS